MTMPKTSAEIQSLLEEMAETIREELADKDPLLVGIHTGGVWVAKALQNILGEGFFDAPLGTLNIAYYRDDFTRIGMHPQVSPSDLPFEVDNRHLVLVDDIFYSGRTTRAALNEIFDYGRPASVTLAVLIERNGRELPIRPDIVGASVTLPRNQHLKLRNKDGLQLEIRAAGALNAE
ncbi:bifunctional pyr operon transcriptional regulator/uracil phosphoribosyltransferase PyrR [Methylophaga nitratireducenticrescens]|uniref:bifunctional pyr operon transcriptional regulator/uracil phosphoribosyltransferase PyrR n=1 Tax=Methylophaga nitratireducenticrescens TaxID=754476 RepID=UPI000CDC580D|nr:bifunctional pyr operon transcriptional regulator/uracil phosphoribosyltransferase PyrR [Methylophaga nitratireducenticrescens]AUZ83265.1 bifunctional pyr operon transcriptional regulator/uracil phosphoribosyltransferase [Methylophaga nitratireducenticrescens]